MSGAEAVATLALVCNIIQLVGVGIKTAKSARQLFKSGAFDPELTEYVEHTIDASLAITAQKRPPDLTSDQQRLLKVAEVCQNAANDLQQEITSLACPETKGNHVKAISAFFKILWRRRRLNALARKLQKAYKMMQDGILWRICNRLDELHVDANTLPENLQRFWEQCKEQDFDKLLDRVTEEAIRTRDHVRAEVTNMGADVKEHVTSEINISEQRTQAHIQEAGDNITTKISGALTNLKSASDVDRQRRRLLGSLAFPDMNERRNQGVEAYENTFEWIFHHSASRVVSDSSGTVGNEGFNVLTGGFASWLQSEHKRFWINGKPGSGKTTLIKYILANSRTSNNLNHWNSKHIIISHFFWRPGSVMQHNVKGMLCSLLHQLFLGSTDVANSVLENSDVDLKEHDTDWSETELHRHFCDIIKNYPKGVCLFLDGLDEVTPVEELQKLLNMLESFSSIRNVKICLSSRPEALIKSRLGDCQALRLQDLTFADLYSYAKGNVEFPQGKTKLPDKDRKVILNTLIERAEGVFLWLYLAVNSVNRGLRYDDDQSTLLKRVSSLPGDLIGMYKDMIGRAADDKDLYQEEAALFFSLALFYSHPRVPFSWNVSEVRRGVTVLDMMLISRNMPGELLNMDHPVRDPQYFLDQLKQTIRDVETRCGGLLEVSDSVNFERLSSSETADPTLPDSENDASEYEESFAWDGRPYNTLVPFTDMGLHFRFIHRTAQDFLLDTAEGRAIWGNDSTTFELEYVTLLEAHLAASRLFFIREPRHSSIIETTVEHYLEAISCLETFHSDAKTSWSAEIQRLTTICGNLFESGRLRSFRLVDPLRGRHAADFVVICAAMHMYDFVLSKAGAMQVPDSLKSEVLLNLHNHRWGMLTQSEQEACSKLTKWLLENGAEPNWRGVRLPQADCGFVLSFQTPFTSFVEATLRASWTTAMTPVGCIALLQAAVQMVQHGANLTEPVYVATNIGGDPASSISNLSFALEADDNLTQFMVATVPAYQLLQAAIRRTRKMSPDLLESFEAKDAMKHLDDQFAKADAKARFVAMFGITRLEPNGCVQYMADEDVDPLVDKLVSLLDECCDLAPFASFKDQCMEVYAKGKKSTEGIYDFFEKEGVLARRPVW